MRMMAELLRQGRYADEVMAILDQERVVAGAAAKRIYRLHDDEELAGRRAPDT